MYKGSVSFTPDGQRIIYGFINDADSSYLIENVFWDIDSQQKVKSFKGWIYPTNPWISGRDVIIVFEIDWDELVIDKVVFREESSGKIIKTISDSTILQESSKSIEDGKVFLGQNNNIVLVSQDTSSRGVYLKNIDTGKNF